MTWTISWPDGEPPDQQRRQSAALPVIAGHTWVAEVDSRGTRAGDRVLWLYVGARWDAFPQLALNRSLSAATLGR